MERPTFVKLAHAALEHIDEGLGALEHESLDLDLAGDVLTLRFADGDAYVINAHSAAGQIWMAADRSAWHFDYDDERGCWIAKKTGDELMRTVSQRVGERLGVAIAL